jgi:hypothetical protein
VLTRATGSERALRVATTGLAAVHSAARRRGGTIDDVVLTAVGGALGTLLARRGEAIEEIVVSVPISGRRGTGADRLATRSGCPPSRSPRSAHPTSATSE